MQAPVLRRAERAQGRDLAGAGRHAEYIVFNAANTAPMPISTAIVVPT